jgi:hypothetical protein
VIKAYRQTHSLFLGALIMNFNLIEDRIWEVIEWSIGGESVYSAAIRQIKSRGLGVAPTVLLEFSSVDK